MKNARLLAVFAALLAAALVFSVFAFRQEKTVRFGLAAGPQSWWACALPGYSGRAYETVVYADDAAALAALGSAYLFFKEDSTLMKAAALLGILSAPVLAMMPQIPRWGGFGAALSVLPVLFFCLWLVVFYKENAANPILWSYGMEILAIAMCLLAVFRLSAYLFYRAKPRRAIFACMLALITSLATLTDSVSLGARAVLGGWGIGTAVMCWIIINNFVPPAPEEDTY